jgi:hypothetical protein
VSDVTTQPSGHRLFARYACAPNARGFCGPPAGSGLAAVACGRGAGVDVASVAARFSGAWPYQCLIAEQAGIDDPLDERVVRAYWTGNALTRAIDGRRLGEQLLERFAAQAGHYWSHLTEDLLDEVTPTHVFHVLGVYPWTRLLAGGGDVPLHVLDACRIRSAEVLDLRAERVLVRARALTWNGRELGLAAPTDELVSWRLPSGTFTGPLYEGARVALHWGHICDELGDGGADELDHWTDLQIEVTNQRLDRSSRDSTPPRVAGGAVSGERRD